MNNKKYEFKYRRGSNASNKLIKLLIKLMDEWINLEMYG